MVDTGRVAGSAGSVQRGSDAWARRRERIGMEIERKALELCAEHGIDDVTVEQIAEAAGISERTFFRYFPARADVLAALPLRSNREIARRVAGRPVHESVIEAFIAATQESFEQEQDGMVSLWGRACYRDGRLAVARTGNLEGGMLGTFTPVIAERLGIEADDLRARVMANAIAGAVWLAFLRWLEDEMKGSLSSLMEEYFNVLADLNRHAGT
jgi:TetR/AcrR family transcriptional regulator, regulator of mycofactocin system